MDIVLCNTPKDPRDPNKISKKECQNMQFLLIEKTYFSTYSI